MANPTITVLVFSGTVGSTVDKQNGATSVSTVTTAQLGSVTPSTNGQVIVSFLAPNGPYTVPTIDTSFIITDAIVSGSSRLQTAAYLIQGTAGAVNPTWNWTSSTSGFAGTNGTFK